MRKATILLNVLLVVSMIAGWANPYSARQFGSRSADPVFQTQKLNVDGEEVTIIRDQFGVPHILAATKRGAFFGGGYAVAQDRLFQLERFRRDARGEIAEIEGPQAFIRDLRTRLFRYTEPELQSIFNSLGGDVGLAFQAYADGINFRTREVISNKELPDEFKKAGIAEPPPWKVTDSVAVAITMATRYGPGGGNETLNARILRKLKEKFGGAADAIFNDLFYLNDPEAPTTIPDSERSTTNRRFKKVMSAAQTIHASDEEMIETAKAALQVEVYQYAKEHGLPTKWGSFCWALAPSRSASGSAILVGCPQMGFSIPPISHEIHYSAADLNVIGMGIAGIPGVIIGHNDFIAWTMTSGVTDMRDTFIEKLNPQNRNQYLYKGTYHDLQRRTESIKIKGEEPRTINVVRTVHGPVVGSDVRPIENASELYAVAVSYAGNELKTFEAVYGFNYAKNLNEFGKLAEQIYTSHNFVAVTIDGDIGYWHCGRPPIRARGHDPRLPVLGTGEYDWQGLMPASDIPHLINPRQGYIVNWNTKPISSWNHGDYPRWGRVAYVTRIEELIKSRRLMTFEQARDMAEDIGTHHPLAQYLKPYLLMALDKADQHKLDERVKQAGVLLRAWDNHSVDGSVARTIFDEWFWVVREKIFADELGGLKAPDLQLSQQSAFDLFADENLLMRVLEGAKSGLPLSRDYLNGRDKNEVIIESLRKALDNLAARLGPQMNLWGTKQGEIDFGPLAGIPNTERGTYTLAVEASKPIFRSFSILPPGQSESSHSPHFSDQREMAGFWRYKPLLYKREQLERALPKQKPESD
jgi:penicillin G amidase